MGAARWLCVIVGVGLRLVLCDDSPPLKTSFVIGIVAKPRQSKIANFDPTYLQTFDKYLNLAGASADPPLTFSIRNFPDEPRIMSAMESNTIDLAFAPASVMSCLQVEDVAVPLVTIIFDELTGTTQEDSIMLTRAQDPRELTLEKLGSGTAAIRVGVTCLSDGPGFLYPLSELAAHGMSLLQDPQQLVFLGCNGQNVITALFNGAVDVGFVGRRTFDMTVQVGQVQRSSFRIAAVLGGPNARPWTQPNSTVLPAWGVAFQSGLDAMQMFKISSWLLSLNRTSPEVVMGGYAGWRPPQSYFKISDMQRSVGLVASSKSAGSDFMCLRDDHLETKPSAEAYMYLKCPAGMEFQTTECEEEKFCPGLFCLCRPCAKDPQLELVTRLAGGIYEGIQQQPITLRVIDWGYRPGVVTAGRNLTWCLVSNGDGIGRTGEPVDKSTRGRFERNGSDPQYYEMNTTINMVSHFLIEVYDGGVSTWFSPVIVQVKQHSRCLGGRVPNQETGECTCVSGYFAVDKGQCTAVDMVIGLLFGGIIFVSFLGALTYRWNSSQRSKWRVDSWLLKADDVMFDEPQVIVGAGTFGPILKGNVRGTEVAFKRMWMKHSGGDAMTAEDKKVPHDTMIDICDVSVRERSWINLSPVENTDHLFENLSGVEVNKALRIPLEGLDMIQGTLKTSLNEALELDLVRSVIAKLNIAGADSIGRGGSSGIGDLSRYFRPSKAQHLKSTSFDPIELELPRRREPKMGNSSSVEIEVCCSESELQKKSFTSSSMTSSFMSSTDRPGKIGKFDSRGRCVDLSAVKYTTFKEEMREILRVRHPCIVAVIGAVMSRKADPYLVLEYMDQHSLHDIIDNKVVLLDNDMLMPILKDVVTGMQCLHEHEKPIIHGDLRAKNVLVDKNFRAKVHNFGFTNKALCGIEGSPYWMSPERLRGGKPTAEADVYSYGVLLSEVFNRQEPFEGEDMKSVLLLIADDSQINGSCRKFGRREPRSLKRPAVLPTTPRNIRKLMSQCWDDDPLKRPTFREISDDMLATLGVANQAFETIKMTKQLAQGANEVLQQVFPRHVVDRLVAGQKVEPEHKEEVSIFFSDIVGYTKIASLLEPHQISNLLDRLYTKFDQLSVELDVFKVETIGDAYMAVANLHKDQSLDHMRRLTDFALSAVRAANKTVVCEGQPHLGHVQIRCGIHVGPVVAHVVGTRNPRYCLFGDTVNTASRMESTSLPGQVQISATAARLLNRQSACSMQCRGRIEIKGKGQMLTWLVNALEAPQAGRRRAASDGGAEILKSWEIEEPLQWSTHVGQLKFAAEAEASQGSPSQGSPMMSKNVGVWSNKIDRLISDGQSIKSRPSSDGVGPRRSSSHSFDFKDINSESLATTSLVDIQDIPQRERPNVGSVDMSSQRSSFEEGSLMSPMSKINRKLTKKQFASVIRRSVSTKKSASSDRLCEAVDFAHRKSLDGHLDLKTSTLDRLEAVKLTLDDAERRRSPPRLQTSEISSEVINSNVFDWGEDDSQSRTRTKIRP